MEFKVDREVTINHVNLRMVKLRALNCQTFYKIMTDVLDVWDSDTEFEDEVGDGWSTFVS